MTQSILDIFEDVVACSRATAELRKGAYRLDASFYSAENRAAIEAVEDSGLQTDPLSEIAEVFCSGVRERTFVQRGVGYILLTGSDLDTATDADLRYVSPLFTRNHSIERLTRGDVLISSAGTVGKCDFVWKNHENRLASQDIVRVRAETNKVRPGYLYALFSSSLGSALLTNQSAGSVIVRIYTEHLDTLQVPRVSDATEERISKKIVASFEARAISRELLTSAQTDLLSVNKLMPLPAEEEESPDFFDLSGLLLETGETRLEAHYYNPVVLAAINNLQKCPSKKNTVGELSHDVIMGGRFKRNYVESNFGTPFLSGKNIIQIRPSDLKYLSNSETEDLSDMLVRRGWILVTCSGTIGRTCFVWHNFEDYAASQHILRVLPDNSLVDPGYLFAFLASDYGYHQILRFRHGSVIDEITDNQLKQVIVPLPSLAHQKRIGDQVRLAYQKRAEALTLENEAQEILLQEFKGKRAKEN